MLSVALFDCYTACHFSECHCAENNYVVCYGAVIVTGLNVTFIIQGTQHNVVLRDTCFCYAECRCAECCCSLAVTSVSLYFKTFIATADFVM